ncbi:MAG: sugar transferase, partial [Deltaproteobacteria bacterium]|nr:sugar transferase [Deltaproteobacteria bacterium]
MEFLLFLGVLYAVHLGRFLILEGWDSYWLFNGRQYLGKSLFFVLVCQASMYLNELYDYRLSWGRRETMIRLLQSLGVACVALGLLYWVFKELAVGAYAFLIGLPLFILLIFRLWDPYLRLTRLPAFLQRVVVLGHSEVVDQIIQRVAEERDSGYRIIGLFSEDQPAPVVAGGRLEPSRVFPMSEFTDRIRAMEVERIVVAIRDRRGTLPFQDLVNLRFRGIQVEEISSFYETLYGKIFIGDLRPSWLIFSEGFRKSSLTLRVKRLLDLVLATVLLVLSFPVLLLVAVLIKLDSRGPVVYRQDRVGEGWKDYTVFKFRSMVQDAEAQGV